MLFEREDFVSYELAATWADYHPDEPGGSQGGRSLVPNEYDGRKLGSWFDKLRPALKTMMPLGGMMVGRNDLPHVFKMTQSAQVRAARRPHGGAAMPATGCAIAAARVWSMATPWSPSSQ